MKSIFINKDSKLRSGYKILLVFIAINVLIMIFETLLTVLMIAFRIKRSYLSSAAQYLQEIIFFIVPVISWKLIEKKPLKDMGFTKNKKGFLDFLFGMFLGAAFISIVFFVLLFSRNIQISKSILKPDFTVNTFTDILLFMSVGFAEETFCRGYCMGSMMQTRNKWLILIVPSVIFSALHSFNPHMRPLFFINTFLIGLLFSYMRLKASDIWLPIGFHAMWDYFEGSVWGLYDSGIPQNGVYHSIVSSKNIINGGFTGPEGGIIVTLVVLAGFIVIKMCYKKQDSKVIISR